MCALRFTDDGTLKPTSRRSVVHAAKAGRIETASQSNLKARWRWSVVFTWATVSMNVGTPH